MTQHETANMTTADALKGIWSAARMNPAAFQQITLPEDPQCLPSSFRVGTAAQASIAAAALAAEQIYHLRSGQQQSVRVSKTGAELECTGYFKLNGTNPTAWEKFSGLYATRDGFVRIHANFEHHRDGVLDLLGLPDASHAKPDDVTAALKNWSALDFETAAAGKGLVVSKVRTFEEWDAHPHAIATRSLPLVSIEKLDDRPACVLADIQLDQRPLSDIRVLDLTRILAGPICGRTLAAYGADVMLLNSPELPNISAIIDTSRGKRSAHLDLKQREGFVVFKQLLKSAHIFVQGYRPGALSGLGLSPEQLAELRPGIICVSLSAYGSQGPWSERRGFDSLVQTATGFNHAEADAAGSSIPKPLPIQILDYASGFLMAFGAQAALLKQATEGGSWHVQVSLLQTAAWLRNLGRQAGGLDTQPPQLKAYLQEFPCSEGTLLGMPHAAEFSRTHPTWLRPSTLPGANSADWEIPVE